MELLWQMRWRLLSAQVESCYVYEVRKQKKKFTKYNNQIVWQLGWYKPSTHISCCAPRFKDLFGNIWISLSIIPTSASFLTILNFFVYFQFSVSQITWQIWQTNNHIKSTKPNRISIDVVLGSEKEFVITKAQTLSPGHCAVYQWSEPSVIPVSYSGAPASFLTINYKN